MKRVVFLATIIIFSIMLAILFLRCSPKYVIINNAANYLENNKCDSILIRTYNISFKLFTRDLDTTNMTTKLFLDSLATEFVSDSSIVSIKIGIHLALKDWSDEYSFRLDNMWQQIIVYLNKRGCDKIDISGENYYNTQPLKSEPLDETYSEFISNEYKYNRRVEFLVIRR